MSHRGVNLGAVAFPSLGGALCGQAAGTWTPPAWVKPSQGRLVLGAAGILRTVECLAASLAMTHSMARAPHTQL